MAQLKDVIAYFCAHYPHKDELSKSRLTKLIYLADWKAAIDHNEQITDINWIFNHYGPYVEDIARLAQNDADFNVARGINEYGNPKSMISLKNEDLTISLDDKDQAILDYVINSTKRLYWNDFIKLVYSTYPVLTGQRGKRLDLIEAARRYSANKAA